MSNAPALGTDENKKACKGSDYHCGKIPLKAAATEKALGVCRADPSPALSGLQSTLTPLLAQLQDLRHRPLGALPRAGGLGLEMRKTTEVHLGLPL